MPLEELKGKLHSLIEATDNEVLLEDLLLEAESRLNTTKTFEAEGISKEDLEELSSMISQAMGKDTITYDELKSSLGRWFIR